MNDTSKGVIEGLTFTVSNYCKSSLSNSLRDESGSGVKASNALGKIILKVKSLAHQTRSTIAVRLNSTLHGNKYENY